LSRIAQVLSFGRGDGVNRHGTKVGTGTTSAFLRGSFYASPQPNRQLSAGRSFGRQLASQRHSTSVLPLALPHCSSCLLQPPVGAWPVVLHSSLVFSACALSQSLCWLFLRQSTQRAIAYPAHQLLPVAQLNRLASSDRPSPILPHLLDYGYAHFE
jgi:hypothetical protein